MFLKRFERIISKIMIVIGLVLTLDTIFVAILVNINFGTTMPAILGMPVFLWGIFYKKIKELSAEKVLVKVLKTLVIAGYIIFIVTFAIITSLTAGHAGTVPGPDADAVIVLGAGIRGENVSLTLAGRLDKAVEYYKKNPDAVIVVSGGQGFREPIPEALAMRNYLTSRDIPEDKVLMEDKATNTYENFLFSKKILDEKFGERNYRAVFTTTDFHVYRASLIAKDVGLEIQGTGDRSLWYLVPNFYLREYLGVIKYWLLGY